MHPETKLSREGNACRFHFYDLAGRTVLLTGAANGIGRVLAFGLAAQGCNLLLVDLDGEGLHATADSIRQSVGKDVSVETLVCDLSIAANRKRLTERIAASHPVVDALVHNAGIDPRASLENTSIDFFRHVLATNLEPALEITRDLLPQLRRSEAARVVMIGSVTFEIGSAILSAYVASKGAVVGLTRSLAHELGEDNITVNCIAPGAIDVERISTNETDGTGFDSPRFEVPSGKSEDPLLAWQAIKRSLVPQDILGPLCLLLSRAGGGISGQTINIDGGLLHPFASPELQRPLAE